MKKGLKRKPAPEIKRGEKKFEWNVGQKRVIKALLGDPKINEVLIAAGSRCFVAGTLVQTATGPVKIEEIKAGGQVLSVNSSGKIESQQVLKCFHNIQGQLKKNIIFTLRNGTKIECTQEHEIYQKKAKSSAGAIARRILENNRGDWRQIPGQQHGSYTNVELEVYRRDESDEASSRCKRVSSDYDNTEREVSNDKGSPDSSTNLAAQSPGASRDRSHQQRENGQPRREHTLGNSSPECGLDCCARAPVYEQRNQEWDEQKNGVKRREGSGNTKTIQSFAYETGEVGGTLWYNRISTSRCDIPQELEARELDPEDVVEISYYEAEVDTYDICVARNHNYLVSEDNILVSNSGKTFLIVAMIVTMAIKYSGSRHLIARKHFSHVKNSVWADTLPKVLDLLFPQVKPLLYWNNTDYYLLFPNGSEIWIAGLDDKERVDKILGREYLNIFFNECSEIEYDTYLTVKTRLAQLIEGATNRIFADENPPSSKHWSKLRFVDKTDPLRKGVKIKNPDKVYFTQIHPWENKENVSKDYLEMLRDMPEHKRKRFYDGTFRDDAAFALWKSETIENNRVSEAKKPVMQRIVVAVDPAVSTKDTSDDTGIVVKGLGWNGHIYLLADYTGKYTPTEWAKKAVDAYHLWQADNIVAEVNNGGDLVETIIKTVDKLVPYEGIHATRDKMTRAEPVAALAEQGLDHHVGAFEEMEEEQTTWEGKKGDKSPNRIDANVWATFALLPQMAGHGQRMQGNFAQAMQSGMNYGY